MIQARTLPADVAELRGVPVAMGEWEATGGDLVTVNNCRRLVGGLAAAADELTGRALIRVVTVEGETTPIRTCGEATRARVPGVVGTPRQGSRLLAGQPA